MIKQLETHRHSLHTVTEGPLHRFRSILVILGLIPLLLTFSGCGGSASQSARNRTDNTPPPSSNTNNPGVPSPDGPYGRFFGPGVLVKFRDNVSAKSMTSLHKALQIQEKGRFRLVNNLTLVEPSGGQSIEETVAALNASSSVEYAEPNYLLTAFQQSLLPNDPRFASLYGLHNTGQVGGTIDADIDAPEAWALQTGRQVVIAVIDTGVDYTHADLRNNIWVNTDEIPNNGIDDDGNGYIDDIRGWDFANNDNDPMDDNRHGTHVAGIIAAQGNNNTGVVGVNWSARIMPLKFMSAAGGGTTSDAIRAIEYAVANGAKISNNSWGGGAFSQALFDAINAANNAGHLIVAAAGNSGNNNDTSPSYPASYDLPNVIAVAASTPNDTLAGFSNFGARNVDLAAPGVGILSTIPGNAYASLSGTSMASPFVAGVAGLILSNSPNLSITQLRDRLLNTTDPIGSLSGRVATGGRLNAFNAVRVSVPVQNVIVTPNNPSIAAGASLTFTATGGTPPYTWSVSNPAIGSINPSTGRFTALARGTTRVTATDSNGTQGSQTISVTQVSIVPNTGSIGIGQSLQLTANGGTAPYQWRSSNTAIASITSAGVLTGRAAGSVTVTATDANGASVTSGTFTVVNNVSISVDVSATAVGVGDSLSATATGGRAPYQWTSSDPTVLNVNASGIATGTGVGRATLTATDSTGATGTSVPIVVDQITVQASPTSVLVGGTIQLTAFGGTPPYRWSVSDPNIATVSNSGVLTALNPGSVIVTATDSNNIRGRSGALTVTTATSLIQVKPATISVPARWWVRFSAIGGTPPYTWTLTNPAAGTVSTTTGWFRASNAIGTTTTVTVTDANGIVSQSGIINVIASPR